uniref:nucleoside phosphorylase n=1 Tax=Pararhizobium sp. IMCC3301 TaxID=3067904 RepID=UPI002741BD95|nr:nucleoside phosphorylase [Pararhizobium sp. IMCC3301]
MTEFGARFPWVNNRPPHLPCGKGDIASTVLLPGDPDRVDLLAGFLSDARHFGRRREYAAVTGSINGHPLSICSTGIGGPSTEIALVELAALGAKRVIRIGGMGALHAQDSVGTFISVTHAIGNTGTAELYRSVGGRAQADPELASGLSHAAATCGLVCREAGIATTDSYYFGQDRPVQASNIKLDESDTPRLDAFAAQGAAGVDMESETVLTVASFLNLSAGCLLGIRGNRATNAWLDDYEPTQQNLLHIVAEYLKTSQESRGPIPC